MGLPASYMKATLIFADTTTQARATVALWYAHPGGTPPAPATIVSFADDFKTAFEGASLPALPSACALQAVYLIYKSGSTFVDGYSSTAAAAGTVSGDYLPERSAVCIRRRTGLAGRNKRGRIFWPFVPESFQNKGLIAAAGITAYGDVASMVSNTVTAGPDSNVHVPQHLDHKTSTLVPITNTGFLSEVVSRRDRAYPKHPLPIGG